MILLIDSSNRHQYPELMDSMFRMRKRLLIDLLHWDLQADDQGREIDQFDNAHATYFVETPDGRLCRGAWRVFPTTEPYMMETVFPEFMGDRELPKSRHAYEVTRSFVDWAAFDWDEKRSKQVHVQLWCALVEWCIMHDVFEIVSFSDPRITRKSSYLYGKPIWQGDVGNCGDGKARCAIYRPSLEQLRKFRAECDFVQIPAISQFSCGAGLEVRHAG